ncbi:MAG: hypothetical protein GEU87_02500 [Alphaproteobacteria bacterium]|nr:hypothetical protein [Alphaproteobacteria bacterium]
MRASDLLKHITVKNRTIPPGRMLQHARFLPIFCAPEAQPEFHGQAMYREAFANTPDGHAAWEAECQQMIFMQEEQLPPGGITADSKPEHESEAGEELRDGPVMLDRGS